MPRPRKARVRPGYLIRLTLAVLPLLTAGVVVGTPANAGPGEYDFVALTNSARAGAGLAPYAVAGDLSAVARGWAARMAASHSLYHNPGLYSQVSGWSAVGENIGYGGSVSVVNGLLMNSPTHRANILSRTYSQIGVGTAVASDGSLWVVEDFRLPNGASPPPAAAPPAPSYVGSAATA
ncbi:MAG: CAP domain-containing protein, partial [Actinomycetota bacterium]|nr:CAP domain-containing protein [Actinomycetota bacterium]